MRKEEDADFLIRYPFLNEDPVYRPASRDLFIQAQNSLAKRMRNIFLQQNEVFSNMYTQHNVYVCNLLDPSFLFIIIYFDNENKKKLEK